MKNAAKIQLFFDICKYICKILNGVNEEFLLTVEHGYTDHQQSENNSGAVAQSGPGELACAVGTVLEGLNDSCHGIEEHDLMQRRIRHITERIDDRRCVHPEGDKDAEEVRQVTVLGRERRNDQA